jgi:hypothetical protein
LQKQYNHALKEGQCNADKYAIKFLSIKQTCSTVAFVNPIIKGSKNSERFRISPEVTNLKNITTIQQNLSG